MSVKDTLKKKVAPIAVAAATLFTPVATQGAEKPEAEQNPQKMEQIQENEIHKKKKLRDESIDKLAKTKDLTDDDIRVMRMANEDAEKIEASLEKMKALLKSQGMDETELASFDDMVIRNYKSGYVMIECITWDNRYTREDESKSKIFIFDSSRKLIASDIVLAGENTKLFKELDEASREAIENENCRDAVRFKRNGDFRYYNKKSSGIDGGIAGSYGKTPWGENIFHLKYNASAYSDFDVLMYPSKDVGRKGEMTTTVNVRGEDISPNLIRNDDLIDVSYSDTQDNRLTKEGLSISEVRAAFDKKVDDNYPITKFSIGHENKALKMAFEYLQSFQMFWSCRCNEFSPNADPNVYMHAGMYYKDVERMRNCIEQLDKNVYNLLGKMENRIMDPINKDPNYLFDTKEMSDLLLDEYKRSISKTQNKDAVTKSAVQNRVLGR